MYAENGVAAISARESFQWLARRFVCVCVCASRRGPNPSTLWRKYEKSKLCIHWSAANPLIDNEFVELFCSRQFVVVDFFPFAQRGKQQKADFFSHATTTSINVLLQNIFLLMNFYLFRGLPTAAAKRTKWCLSTRQTNKVEQEMRTIKEMCFHSNYFASVTTSHYFFSALRIWRRRRRR